jgi:hypothetical protein
LNSERRDAKFSAKVWGGKKKKKEVNLLITTTTAAKKKHLNIFGGKLLERNNSS